MGIVILSLIGLPGSGKSTVGRQLARRLQLPFHDSDHVIEARLGCSIRQFFEREGEDSFRDVESSVIDELTRAPTAVLSTGGGAVLRPANRLHLRGRGQVVYLKSSPEELFRRLRHVRSLSQFLFGRKVTPEEGNAVCAVCTGEGALETPGIIYVGGHYFGTQGGEGFGLL